MKNRCSTASRTTQSGTASSSPVSSGPRFSKSRSSLALQRSRFCLLHPRGVPMVRKNFRDRIDALHGVRTHGCWENTPVDDKEAFGSPNVKILSHNTVLRMRTHLVRPLHMSRGDHGSVRNELQVVLHQRSLIRRGEYLWLQANLQAHPGRCATTPES